MDSYGRKEAEHRPGIVKASLFAVLGVLFVARCTWAVNDVAGTLYTLNDNGGWSWFEDERAIVDTTANKLIVSSVGNASGTGGAARDGDVEVTSFDLTSHATSRFTLADGLQADDHDSAAILRRPDGTYLVSY